MTSPRVGVSNKLSNGNERCQHIPLNWSMVHFCVLTSRQLVVGEEGRQSVGELTPSEKLHYGWVGLGCGWGLVLGVSQALGGGFGGDCPCVGFRKDGRGMWKI